MIRVNPPSWIGVQYPTIHIQGSLSFDWIPESTTWKSKIQAKKKLHGTKFKLSLYIKIVSFSFVIFILTTRN